MNDIKKKGKAEVKNSFYKDLFFLTFGILLYSFGYTAFILPEQVVMGGVFRYIGAAVLCLRISSRYFDLGA